MSNILYQVENRVARITLNRPNRLNTFTQDVYSELAIALRKAQHDDRVHVLLLSANGTDFSAGNDIKEFVGQMWSADKLADKATPSTDIVFALIELDKPLIASVKGRAIGFGATMLLHCDAVIASESASVRYPFVDLGLVPEAGATALMERLVGHAKALRIFYEAKSILADQALSLGIFSEVVGEDVLGMLSLSYAERLAEKPLSALRATKRLFNRAPEPLEDRVIAEFRALGDCLNSDAAQKAFKNFLNIQN
ncbi:hypothetical protein HBA55_35330 [Pseudomaricurvus alkylphenolicus]|uniref:enoyl-CoA hydratase-related protein n=1 Tax=Pseudomaricurvus alkylphenolicus TaxID=1306991 RepID=UPI001423DBC6|nr:hypothetical protein [Pseudomaricurvus alkylphenolicus]